MTASVKIDRPCHDPEHFIARKERVIALNLDLVGVVGDELEAGTVGIEDLAAAGDEAGPIGLDRSHRVRDADVGGFPVGSGQLPRDTASFRVEGQRQHAT